MRVITKRGKKQVEKISGQSTKKKKLCLYQENGEEE